MKRTCLLLMAAAALLLAPAVPFCAASGLGRSIAMNKLVTPNGDRRNDTFIFRCYNPRDAAVEAKIFNLSGIEVATMNLLPGNHSDFFYTFSWDPNSGGRKPGGVYLYQVRVETSVLKGTITVIR